MKYAENPAAGELPSSSEASRGSYPPANPPSDCPLCPRLVEFRNEWRAKEPTWHNAPVPTFGPSSARLLIIGLAPGLRGANRTGRPFTGDYAGDLLYDTLIEYGFARGEYRADPSDTLELVDAAIVNAVRCVPPQNKPVGAEINNCRPFLAATIARHTDLTAILALGRIAHDSVVRTLGLRLKDAPFGHGAVHEIPGEASGGLRLFDSYHCSRYNTNTGVLTEKMFKGVFAEIRNLLGKPR
ncbi:uracil-DNA glycosylase [Afifella marina]|uniref:Type-5 uracil-DNA glycosylase n=1 Tax=Afifella marina DSM 2698 TaxID=1120955 RepID=A0A1G5MZF7_AFIMA|nr:uracil-DNA glycosylase, family 4 [Afifella marina DSM 2698]